MRPGIEIEAGHPWNGVNSHNCVDCDSESVWKCDIRAHGGPSMDEHGRLTLTPAEQQLRAEWTVRGITQGIERGPRSDALDVERLADALYLAGFMMGEGRPVRVEDMARLAAEYERLDPVYQATLPTADDVRGILSEQPATEPESGGGDG